jgi:hypothetical protein
MVAVFRSRYIRIPSRQSACAARPEWRRRLGETLALSAPQALAAAAYSRRAFQYIRFLAQHRQVCGQIYPDGTEYPTCLIRAAVFLTIRGLRDVINFL